MALENLRTLIQGITGKVGGLGGGARQEAPGYASELSYGNMALAADVVCPVNVWTKVAEYTVPAQELVAVGSGVQGDPHSQGLVDIYLVTVAPAQIVGKFRLLAQNARETKKEVIFEKSSSILHGTGNTDKQGMLLIPESAVKVGEDSKLTLEVMPDAEQTVDFDGATNIIKLPVTIYD